MVKGDAELDESITNIAKDAGKSAVMGYAGLAIGSIAKGTMQQSDKAALRVVAGTALPGMIASMTLEAAQTLCRSGAGEITSSQMIEELGQTSVNTLAGVWGEWPGKSSFQYPWSELW